MRRAELEETVETFEAGYEEIGEVLDNRKLSAKAKLKRIEEIVSGDPEMPDDEGDDDL